MENGHVAGANFVLNGPEYAPMTTKKPTVDLSVLTRAFPPEAVKQRDGGFGKKLDYVDTATVIRRLNEATGNNWNWRYTRFKVIPMGQKALLIVTGQLTIPGLGTREGTGVQYLSEKAEDLAKGAGSDALKKAATNFGVGLELYGPDLEAGETAGESDAQVFARFNPAGPAGPVQRTTPPSDYRPSGQFGPRPISEKQIGYARNLARSVWKDEGEANYQISLWVTENSQADGLETITSQEASRLIDWLKAQQHG